MPKAYRSYQAPVQKLIVIGQVHEFKPGPSYHPLDLLQRWVDRQVGRVLLKIQPWNAPDSIYRPQYESN